MKVKDLVLALAYCDPNAEVVLRKPAAVRVGEFTDYDLDYAEPSEKTSGRAAQLTIVLGDVREITVFN